MSIEYALKNTFRIIYMTYESLFVTLYWLTWMYAFSVKKRKAKVFNTFSSFDVPLLPCIFPFYSTTNCSSSFKIGLCLPWAYQLVITDFSQLLSEYLLTHPTLLHGHIILKPNKVIILKWFILNCKCSNCYPW